MAEQRAVTEEEGREAAEEHGVAKYCETSAKTNEGIEGPLVPRLQQAPPWLDIDVDSYQRDACVLQRRLSSCARKCKVCMRHSRSSTSSWTLRRPPRSPRARAVETLGSGRAADC